jgi:hypothetical protein
VSFLRRATESTEHDAGGRTRIALAQCPCHARRNAINSARNVHGTRFVVRGERLERARKRRARRHAIAADDRFQVRDVSVGDRSRPLAADG